ncbi:MAG: hypothetical protein HYV40_06300 [Candidatus Levybacteria bacterium]|nr:hypothetical protein [Candidatus Levybacteria bacterium]
MLRKTNWSLLIFFAGLCAILLTSSCINGIFFPSDILNYFPLFSENSWRPPHNSLLADPVFQFEPWRWYIKDQLSSGIFPLWNDRNGLGVPFLANPQTALLFPLTIAYLLLPLGSGLLFIHLAKVFLFGFFTFLYLRVIKLGVRSSFFGVLATSSSAFFMTWLLWPHTNVSLFLPLLLFLVEKMRNAHNRVLLYVAFSVCTAFAFFGGHPETFFQVGLIVIAYTLFRFYKSWRILLNIVFFGFIGLSLAGIQLLPFVEYLFNSAEWVRRSNFVIHFLPLASVIQYFFPFTLGAPHLQYYKAFPGTNFQESAGGYVGIIPLILAFIAIVALRKNKLVVFWSVVGIIAFGISYAIPPISWITFLPIFENSANHRFVGILGFSAVVSASVILHSLLRRKALYSHTRFLLILIIGGIASLAVLLLPLLVSGIGLNPPQQFMSLLQMHILLQLLSTAGFFLSLLFLQRSRLLQFFLLLTFFFLQTGFLFWNYVPFTPRNEYYPSPNVVKKLQSLPKGTYVEVGNPSVKVDANILYNLRSVENYDALGIKEYKVLYDSSFPIKNHWDNIDQVSVESLKRFGIRYILSDYDLRLHPFALQKNVSMILPELTKERGYRVSFIPQQEILSGIRLLTANFNRKNTCTFSVSVIQKENEVFTTKHSCLDVRDKMYFYIPIPDIHLIPNQQYQIGIQSDADETNAIALWGGRDPFVQLYYKASESSVFRLLSRGKSTYLFEYPQGERITYSGKFRILTESPQKLVLRTENGNPAKMLIRIPQYPGWDILIDGHLTESSKSHVFLEFVVPPSEHIITVVYRPLSFTSGVLLSIVSFLFLVVLSLRVLVQSNVFSKLLGYLNKSFAPRKKIPLWQHAIVFLVGIFVSLTTYVVMVKILQISFAMPETTAINWYTVHGYPRQQDYFYFYTGFVYVAVVTSSLWILWLWIKRKH